MKFKPGLISCIMPTYNRLDFVIDRITELQDIPNIELIIVNDGGQKLDIEEPKCPYKIIELEHNSGSVTIPRNIGIAYSEGEFIAHTDDDVISHPIKFSIGREFLINNPNKMMFIGLRTDFKNGCEYMPLQPFNWNPLDTWGVDGGQFIYRRSVYDKISPVFARRGCDWELAKAIVKEFGVECIEHISKFVSTYIWHEKNRSLNEATKNKIIYPSNYNHWFKGTIFEGKIPESV